MADAYNDPSAPLPPLSSLSMSAASLEGVMRALARIAERQEAVGDELTQLRAELRPVLRLVDGDTRQSPLSERLWTLEQWVQSRRRVEWLILGAVVTAVAAGVWALALK